MFKYGETMREIEGKYQDERRARMQAEMDLREEERRHQRAAAERDIYRGECDRLRFELAAANEKIERIQADHSEAVEFANEELLRLRTSEDCFRQRSQERDAALAAMWGMICCATELRESVRRASLAELAAELRYLCA